MGIDLVRGRLLERRGSGGEEGQSQEPKREEKKKTKPGAGPVAEWLSSRALLQAAQCFICSNPGRGHGTAHQTTLRQCPICHNGKDPQ